MKNQRALLGYAGRNKDRRALITHTEPQTQARCNHIDTHAMDTFRPGMPPNMHHQLCPVCMAPHFPFCPPNHTYAAHPPQREPYHPGQAAPHLQYEALHRHLGQPFVQAAHPMPDPLFRGGHAAGFSPHPSYFPQGPPAHFTEDKRDRFSQAPRGQFQSAEPFFPDVPQFTQPGKHYHGSNGSMPADFSLQGGPNSWMEAERGFSFQQHRRAAGMGDGIGFGEVPRGDGNVNIPDAQFDRNFRGDYNQTSQDARFERQRSNFATDSLATIGQGRNQFGSMGFPASSWNAGELQETKGSNVYPTDLVNHLHTTSGSYDNGGTQAPQTFGSGSGPCPGPLNSLAQERYSIERKSLAHQAANREDDTLRGHLLLENIQKNEDVSEGVDYALPKKTLKRKHPMSREEELLIEKGLLDDECSQPHMGDRFPYQTQLGNEQFITKSKQGDLQEKDFHFDQSGHRVSTIFSGRELQGAHFGQMGDFDNQRIQSSKPQNERIKNEEIVSGIGLEGNGSNDWPSQDPLVKNMPREGGQNGGKSLSLDSLCSGASCLSSNRPPKSYHQQHEEAQIKKDILYRQYQEWEAEEQHLEALKKAERLAREIQQREEVVHPLRSSHPAHSYSQDLSQENRRLAYHHQEMFRAGSTETGSDAGMLKSATYQHGSQSKHSPLQPLNSYADIKEPQRQEQPQLREGRYAREGGFGQDLQNAQPYVGPHSQIDGLTPHSGSSQSWHNELSNIRNISHQDQSYLQPDRQKEHQIAYKPHLGPQHSQLVPHRDQQLTSSHLFGSQFDVQDPSQKISERSALHGLRYQPMSGMAPDLHGSKPPLPVAACVHPPPPDSPPPPPPAQPPEIVSPPPPPPSATFPSARSSTLQGLPGHSQDYLQKSLPFDGHNYGTLEVHHIEAPVSCGMAQVHKLIPPHFQPQLPQQVEKLKVVDAINIFRNPGRQTRPDRFVVILRGLPGSGKSYLAKALRDVEVMNGGSAPRIHSMDDYFTCEVEKEEEVEMASSARVKKKVVKRVIEYCYEPEMEEAYRASMLKAFKKTLEEGLFKFVIVDDRNVVIADFAQFWAIAKRSGYEVMVLEAPYSDVKGCAARNVHNFTEQQIQSMADRWESTPTLYLKMDVSSLFRADDLNAQDIIEVDMDADDMERDLEEDEEENDQLSEEYHLSSQRTEKPTTGDRWEDKDDTAKEAAASPARKKPSGDIRGRHESNRRNTDNALSGLMTTYGKKDKFVHWSDSQGVKGSSTGFSIGLSQKPASLVIGPGPGYNGVSNLPIEPDDGSRESATLKKSSKFAEQLRAEQEAFRAVVARRRQRIRGMDDDDDD